MGTYGILLAKDLPASFIQKHTLRDVVSPITLLELYNSWASDNPELVAAAKVKGPVGARTVAAATSPRVLEQSQVRGELRAGRPAKGPATPLPPQGRQVGGKGHSTAERGEVRKTGSSVPCLYCNMAGHSMNECNALIKMIREGKIGRRPQPQVRCAYCSRVGHGVESCTVFQGDLRGLRGDSQPGGASDPQGASPDRRTGAGSWDRRPGTMLCFYCQRPGHMKLHCPARLQMKEGRQDSPPPYQKNAERKGST